MTASVAMGDLNIDGRLDLVTANQMDQNVSVLLNETPEGGALSFAQKFNVPSGGGPISVALGDLNGDGKPDLATANPNYDTVSVLLNITPPGASTPAFYSNIDFETGDNPIFVALGDLNSDGKSDLATANHDGGSVSVLLNETPAGADTPTFSTMVNVPAGQKAFAVALGDLDGDGKPDLAIANRRFSSYWVDVRRNTTPSGATTPTFAPSIPFETGDFKIGDRPPTLAMGDLDGDGRPDLATPNQNDDTVSVLLNKTEVPFICWPLPGGGRRCIRPGPFYGELLPDRLRGDSGP